jgi:6-pyruvoyltetrahydropterin/6-carboxytetrahydropterin synthase
LIRVTRRYRFAASHRLHAAELSAEANRDLYGKCNNPFGHGHDYILDVSVKGPVETESGQAVRLSALDALVRSSVLDEFDQSNLNDSAAFAHQVPTTENLVIEIENRLRRVWPGGTWPRLERVQIRETPRNLFTSSGATAA